MATQTRITRLAQTLSSVTSIFRCQGLQHVPEDSDSFGFHDIAFWLIFLAALGGWFVFIFAPERERLSMLDGRHQVLTTHLQAEKREHLRLQRSIDALTRGDPDAWERAARGRLGWLEPGEITDISKQKLTPLPRPPQENSAPQIHAPAPAPIPVLPRPVIPPVPAPVPGIRPTRFADSSSGGVDLLGPIHAAPPPPPVPIVPLPPVPPGAPAIRNNMPGTVPTPAPAPVPADTRRSAAPNSRPADAPSLAPADSRARVATQSSNNRPKKK